MIYMQKHSTDADRGLCGMWRGCHAVWRGGIVRLAGVLLAAAVAVSSPAQESPIAAGEIPGAGVPGVDESHGLRVHRLVEDWVKRGGVPGERAESIRVRGVVGVRVTLRLDGVTLGEGTRVRSDLADQLPTEGGPAWEMLPATDLIGLIEPATEAALDDAVEAVRRRNLEARIRAAGDPEAPTPRGRVTAGEIGPQLAIDIQIALAPERIVIAPDAAPDLVYARFAPGFHGLFTLPPDRPAGDTMVWPATTLAQNASPRRQIVRLLTRSGLGPDQIDRLGRPDGLPLGRFEVLHIVRPQPGLPATRLVRGGRELPQRFVNKPTLIDMADRIGLHLYGRFIGDGRVRGPYQPSRGRYHPDLAGDREATLAAYTLVRLVDQKRKDGNNDQFYASFNDVASQAVRQAVARLLTPDAPPDAVTAAFCLLTILESPADQFDPAMEPRVGGLLRAMVDEGGRLLADPDDPESVLPPASGAAVLAALGRWYEQTRDPQLGQQVAKVFEALWAQTRGRFDVNTLPWITLAHVRTADLLADGGWLEPATRLQRSADLAAMIGLVEERQVVERPALGPADVVGGVVLVRAPEGSPPNPNWQTAQLMSFLATALRDPQIVPEDRRWLVLVTTSGTARFMGQLMINEPDCYAIRSREEAVGGIRLSLWDNTLDLAPSALTLMALLEMRQTLDVLDADKAEAPAEETPATE